MKKFKLLALIIMVAVVLSFSFGVTADVMAADSYTKLVIIHTNDIHSRVDDNMGYARVAALKAQYEAIATNKVLVIDAGDTFHGLPIANINSGENIVSIMNKVGYDYFTPGNHDFNYGYSRLIQLDALLTAKTLSANVVNQSGNPIFTANDTFEYGGVKFGIFGLSTQETEYKTHPDNIEGLTFKDLVETAQAQVTALKAQNCTYIIMLGHLGVDADSAPNRSSDVANAVNGINLAIDGHSHSKLENGQLENGTLIVSANEYLNYIGVVEIDLATKATTAKLVNDKTALTPNAAVEALITTIKAEVNELMKVVVGNTPYLLNGERAFARTQETNLGNLATDAMRFVSGADVAFSNGGGIRASIKAGDITKNDLFSVFPFGNYVVVLDLPLSNLLQALELGVSAAPSESGGFLQISGMCIAYDPTAAVNSKIMSLYIGNTLVWTKAGGYTGDKTADSIIKVATNNFTAAKGDNYTMLGNNYISGEFMALEEAMIAYVSTMNDSTWVNYSGVDARVCVINTITINTKGEVVVVAKDGLRVVLTNGTNGSGSSNIVPIILSIVAILIGITCLHLILKKKNVEVD